MNDELTTLNARALTNVGQYLEVRARPRPHSADRNRSRMHRTEPALLVATRAPGR